MSYFGNIENGNKTNLTFDKVYPNRYQMDRGASTDGVFIGRYVFIEYDDNTFPYRFGYMNNNVSETGRKNIIYADSEYKFPYKITYPNEEGYGLDYVEFEDIIIVDLDDYRAFFVCKGQDDEGVALFNLVTQSPEKDYDYQHNYNIDKNYYKDTFKDGWDSTVWQKVFVNGEFKYALVGELNSKTPRFTLRPEAPTEFPQVPHFDEISTNIDYILHAQPMWGLRLRKADDENFSDMDAPGDYYTYNEETGESENVSVENKYPADIYFNGNALKTDEESIKTRYYSPEDVENQISFIPGKSGQKYYSHNDNKFEARDDIKELQIHFPGIGDAVAKLWDLMYAEYDRDEEGNPIIKEKRNLNIGWDNDKGAKMVTPGPSGYHYEAKNVESVAGCLNSIHDLMGKIIDVDTEGLLLSDADTEHIYYGKLGDAKRAGFFMKTPYCYYTPLFPDELDEFYTNSSKKYYDLTQYQKNYYHIKSDGNYYFETNDFPTSNKNHYTLDPKRIQLMPWVQEEIEEEEENPDIKKPMIHYYINLSKSYIKDNNEQADPTKTYYTIVPTQATYLEDDMVNRTEKTEIFKPYGRTEYIDPNNGKTCYKGCLYFLIDRYDENTNAPIYNDQAYELTAQDTFKENAVYFEVDKYYTEKGTDSSLGIVETLMNPYNGKAYNATNMPPEESRIVFLPFAYNTYYLKDEEENYHLLNNINEYNKEIIYYTIASTPETGDFKVNPDDEESTETIFTHYYLPDVYYYKYNLNDYIKGTDDEMLEDVEYYIISDDDVTLHDVTFYQPSEYFYQKEITNDKGEREIIEILDNDDIMKTYQTELPNGEKIIYNSDNLVYYLSKKAYVTKDPSGILSVGSVWNSGSNVPEGLELGKLYEGERVIREYNENGVLVDKILQNPEDKAIRQFKWQELDGFASTLNTIHGLILKINQYFKFNDTLTRDRRTIQGCLNTINDLINDFGKLIPGEIAVIDEYGRIKSATLFTTEADDSDGWISVGIDPNAIDTKITIRHKDAKTPDTILGQTAPKTLTFGDTFKALSFGIDDKGHIAEDNFNEVTMTMPQLKVNDSQTSQIVTDVTIGEQGQAIVLNRENVGNFTLTGYTYPASATDVAATDTVNTGFGKLQRSLNNEISNRQNENTSLQNALNSEATTRQTEDTKLQNNLNAEVAARQSEDAKLQGQLDILNAGSNQVGSVAYQIAQIVTPDGGAIDKLEEIAAWIISDTTGAAKMNADIKDNADAIAELEQLVGDTAVATQISNAIAEALTSGSTDKYALATDLINATNRISGIEAILTEEKINQWNSAEANVQSDWNENNSNSDSFIKNKPDFSNFVKTNTTFNYTYNDSTTAMTINDLMAYIASLEKRIADLEGIIVTP